MKKLELIESVIMLANNGEDLRRGEICRYSKDSLDDRELNRCE